MINWYRYKPAVKISQGKRFMRLKKHIKPIDAQKERRLYLRELARGESQ